MTKSNASKASESLATPSASRREFKFKHNALEVVAGALERGFRMQPPEAEEIGPSTPLPVDVAAVDGFAALLVRHDLHELEIEHGAFRLRLARSSVAPTRSGAATRAEPPIAGGETEDDTPGLVQSPMVGVAYLRPGPGDEPLVAVGSTVKTGDRLMLIEALGVFHDIVAPRPGKVAEILVDDGTPVEFGQPLILLAAGAA